MALNTVRAAVIIMLGTLLSKVLGFARDIVLAASYGTSSVADAYLTALIIPTMIFGSIGIALGTTFIPEYSEIREKRGGGAALHFTNATINHVMLVCAGVALLGMVFAEPLVRYVAIGFEGDTVALTVRMTQIMLPGILFVCLNYVLMSYLQLHDQFKVPALMGIPFNGVIILFTLFSVVGDVLLLAYGTLLALVLQFAVQWWYARKKGLRYRIRRSWQHPGVKKLALILFPVFLGVSVLQLNVLADRVFASTLAEGSVSALSYAVRLKEFVFGVFTMSIAAAIFPHFSKTASQGDVNKLASHLRTAVHVVILVTLPIAVGMIMLSEPIIAVLFERGSFDAAATSMTAGALLFYSIGIIGFGLRDVLIRTFYAISDSRTPMWNSLLIIALNVGLNVLLMPLLEHRGLALATSIAIVVGTVILMVQLQLKLKYIELLPLCGLAGKIGLASVIMGGAVKWVYDQLAIRLAPGFTFELISIAGSVLIGAALYIGLLVLFRVQETRLLLQLLKRRR